jgi:hypothetical protein
MCRMMSVVSTFQARQIDHRPAGRSAVDFKLSGAQPSSHQAQP